MSIGHVFFDLQFHPLRCFPCVQSVSGEGVLRSIDRGKGYAGTNVRGMAALENCWFRHDECCIARAFRVQRWNSLC